MTLIAVALPSVQLLVTEVVPVLFSVPFNTTYCPTVALCAWTTDELSDPADRYPTASAEVLELLTKDIVPLPFRIRLVFVIPAPLYTLSRLPSTVTFGTLISPKLLI